MGIRLYVVASINLDTGVVYKYGIERSLVRTVEDCSELSALHKNKYYYYPVLASDEPTKLDVLNRSDSVNWSSSSFDSLYVDNLPTAV